jgi:hypothetical protein
MPIPNFDHNNVLPPHLGDPTLSVHLSPYHCTIIELCHKFCTSPYRIQILRNLVLFRQKITTLGVIFGFQWLDGSFVENIEASQARHPNDLDIVTFYGGLSIPEQRTIGINLPEFFSPVIAKSNFLLDHYAFDYGFKPEITVEMTRYWVQLFTHNRLGVWKGILRLPLNTPIDDQHALDFLNSI